MPGRSAIVGLLGEVNRAGAARRAARVYTRSVHVHQAVEPSSPASPVPLDPHVPTTNQENVRMVLPFGRETAAVRRAQKLASLFSGALAIYLFISGYAILIYILLQFLLHTSLKGEGGYTSGTEQHNKVCLSVGVTGQFGCLFQRMCILK